MIKSNPDPALHINKNPLYCGTMLLSQMVMLENLGNGLANYHLSIFTMAHLYNISKKLSLVENVWDDTEKIIELHTRPIFAGDIPSTPEEMSARINHRLGLDRNLKYSSITKQSLMRREIPMSSASGLNEFFGSSQPLEKTIYQLQDLLRKRQEKGNKN